MRVRTYLMIAATTSLLLTGCGGLSRSTALETLNKVATDQHASVIFTEVTGIADTPMGQGMKEVHYTYKWEKSMEKHGGTKARPGVAVFRHYDDGWRVESINGTGINVMVGKPGHDEVEKWLFDIYMADGDDQLFHPAN